MGKKQPARKQATKKLELIISGGANKLQNYFQWKWQRSWSAMGGKGEATAKVAGAAAEYKKLTSIKVP